MWVMRHGFENQQGQLEPIPFKWDAVMRFSFYPPLGFPDLPKIHPPSPSFCPIIEIFMEWWTEAFNIRTKYHCMSNMTEIQGYCMKCKQYGPIKDGEKIVMSNGRTRMAGFCSQSGCTGKISKIIAWAQHTDLPNWFNRNVRWVNLPRARGLGVYDVALTWQRSRVRFSPSPPMNKSYLMFVNHKH